MTEAFYAIAKASFQGSIVILAVLILRLLLKKAPKSLFCLLWLLAGILFRGDWLTVGLYCVLASMLLAALPLTASAAEVYYVNGTVGESLYYVFFNDSVFVFVYFERTC
mgnify:CR=1 FL=1